MKTLISTLIIVFASISATATTNVDLNCIGSELQFSTNLIFKTQETLLKINVISGSDSREDQLSVKVTALEQGTYYSDSTVFTVRGSTTETKTSIWLSAKIKNNEIEYINGIQNMYNSEGMMIGKCTIHLNN